MTDAVKISGLGSLRSRKVRIRSGGIGDSNQSIILYIIRLCSVKYYLMDWSNVKLAFKALDFDCGQGVIRFKSGAYTPVREHFESNHNAVHGQKMMV